MTVPIWVGYDTRESVAYHVFCQSVISHSRIPVSFHPLTLQSLRSLYTEKHDDGSNAFIYSRFLVPHLMGYKGWAIFADGDMVCRGDIEWLWKLRDDSKAAMVVKHEYTTRFDRKYVGTSMETINTTYPRKNWSSVILWNCEHPANAVLTPDYVMESPGRKLHRFEHLKDDEIGELPKVWNWLPQEHGEKPDAQLIHYSIGVPGIKHYEDGPMASYWFDTLAAVNHIQT